MLDGIDISTVDPAGLRAAIGGKYQDFVTYQATAGENIGLGEVARIEDAAAVSAAARNAGAAPGAPLFSSALFMQVYNFNLPPAKSGQVTLVSLNGPVVLNNDTAPTCVTLLPTSPRSGA